MTTSTAVDERRATLIRRACARPDGTSLFESVSAQLRQLVGFDGAGWAGTDPATLLPSGPVRCENVEVRHDHHSPWHRELLVNDVLLYRSLARAAQPAGTLYGFAEGHPARSPRYREFLQPQGYGDELRAVFRVGGATWGVVSLFRDHGRRPFSADDLDLVLAVAPVIGTALRTQALSAAPPAIPAGADGPGTALYDAIYRSCRDKLRVRKTDERERRIRADDRSCDRAGRYLTAQCNMSSGHASRAGNLRDEDDAEGNTDAGREDDRCP